MQISKIKSIIKQGDLIKFFKEIGRADELGSGIKKLFKYCKIYSGSDPELIEEDIFKTIIPLEVKTAKENSIEEESIEKVSKTREKTRGKTREKTREKIIKLVKRKPEITINEMANQIGITEKGIEWQIKKLKKAKQLKRIGKKGGYWKIIGEG
jgi:ATP-dependent DNA helicase RecG